jgi:hypothetical protein
LADYKLLILTLVLLYIFSKISVEVITIVAMSGRDRSHPPSKLFAICMPRKGKRASLLSSSDFNMHSSMAETESGGYRHSLIDYVNIFPLLWER